MYHVLGFENQVQIMIDITYVQVMLYCMSAQPCLATTVQEPFTYSTGLGT
jgi:hypothetical protein